MAEDDTIAIDDEDSSKTADKDKKGKTNTKDKFSRAKNAQWLGLNSGREVIAEPEEWIIEDGSMLASQSKYHCVWRMTISKSQGMTFRCCRD